MAQKIDWDKAQKMYSEGMTLEEIGDSLGATRQTVSKYIDKDNTFALYKLQVFYEKLVAPGNSDKKVETITGIPLSTTRVWWDKMFTKMSYSNGFKTNGLGCIGDFVRANKKLKEEIREELLTKMPNGKRKLQVMIEIQNLQEVNCYSDSMSKTETHGSSLYQIDDDLTSEYIIEPHTNDEMDEIDQICVDYFEGSLDDVEIGRCLGPLRELSRKGVLHSLTEMEDVYQALFRMTDDNRLSIIHHFRDRGLVGYEDLYRAKGELREELKYLLEI